MSDFVFAFMDCEFGGLDPELHDITEVAIIVTDYRLAELASAEWKVGAREDRVTPEAAEISGYTPEAWKDALPLRKVLGEIADLLPRGRTAVPAGQNVRMDVQFLERAQAPHASKGAKDRRQRPAVKQRIGGKLTFADIIIDDRKIRRIQCH